MARRFAWLVATAAVVGYSIDILPALAQTREVEPRLAIRVGTATTDNLGRETVAADAERETFATTGVDIGVLRESARARAYVDGTVDYYAYDSDQFSNETSGAIDGGLSIRVAPEVFSWEFRDTLDHSRLNPFEPVGPANRDRINTFSTGPRASIPLGERSRFGVVGRYTDRHYEESVTLEGNTRAASVDISHDLSQMQRLGFTVAGRDIRFDDPVSRPYEIHDAYLSYERQAAANGSFAINAGSSLLRREGESASEPYFEVAWVRDVTVRSTVTLEASQSFEGPGEDFDAGGLEGHEGGGLGDTTLVDDPRVRADASFTYRLTRTRAVFSARHERFREKFQNTLFNNREGSRSSAGFEYRFTRKLRGVVDLGVGRESLEGSGTADERYAQARLARQLGRNWDASLAFEYNGRKPDVGDAYTERRYILSLVWVPARQGD